MIQEAYCSYEISRLLKEKGFNEKTFTFYIKGQPYNLQNNFRGIKFSNSEMENAHSSPTLQMACAWLREIYGIDIVIEISDPSVKDRKYYCIIWDGNNDSYILDLFNSYEEAVEAALKYVLEKLI